MKGPSYERFINLLFITEGPVTNDIALLSIIIIIALHVVLLWYLNYGEQ